MTTAPRPDDSAEFFDKINAAIAQVDVRPDGVFEDRDAFERWLRNEIRQYAASRAPALDPVFGLPQGDQPQAAVQAAPSRQRAAPRRKGDQEAAVAAYLRTLPKELGKHPVAASLIKLARDIDEGLVTGKDVPVNAREIRLGTDRLEELRPAGGQGDKTDEVRDARERRLERRQAQTADAT